MNPYAAFGLGLLVGFGATVFGVAAGTMFSKKKRLDLERKRIVAALIASCVAVASCGGGGDDESRSTTQPVDCSNKANCK